MGLTNRPHGSASYCQIAARGFKLVCASPTGPAASEPILPDPTMQARTASRPAASATQPEPRRRSAPPGRSLRNRRTTRIATKVSQTGRLTSRGNRSGVVEALRHQHGPRSRASSDSDPRGACRCQSSPRRGDGTWWHAYRVSRQRSPGERARQPCDEQGSNGAVQLAAVAWSSASQKGAPQMSKWNFVAIGQVGLTGWTREVAKPVAQSIARRTGRPEAGDPVAYRCGTPCGHVDRLPPQCRCRHRRGANRPSASEEFSRRGIAARGRPSAGCYRARAGEGNGPS